MPNSETTGSSGGIGFCGLLTIVFVIFKLLGKLTWSWWWVFAPIWMPSAAALSIFAAFLLLVAIGAIVEAFRG